MDGRRAFLKKAAILTGAASMQQVIPMSIQRAMAINAAPGTTFNDAEHIVFLMQENRSFDHMFGKLKGVRGFNDPHPHILPNKNKVWLQQDKNGNTFPPFHIDINKTKVTWQGGLPHSWKDQIAARNQGKYDKWVPVKSLMAMGHYQRTDIPFYYNLADAFTVCDHSFCSSLTGTTPNRLFFFTGGNRDGKSGEAVVNNSQAESRDNVYVDWDTLPEILEDNGIDWRVYQNEIWTANLPEEQDDWLGNYGDNPLEYVKRYNVRLSAYFRKNGDKQNNLSAANVTEKYNALTQREKNLIDKAFTTNIENPHYLNLAPFNYKDEQGKDQTLQIPKDDIFYRFRKDVNEGKLPTVSWLVSPQRFSDHTSSPLYGTWYVSEALDILTKNPEVWKKTIFILTYDENDGYFDHLPPFVAPKPNSPASGKVSSSINTALDFEGKAQSPIGLGYRVPMVVASPWSKGGYVNSQIFDHTSANLFLEQFLSKKTGKSFKNELISNWRRHICGDLTSVFRPYNGEIIQSPKSLKRDTVINNIQQVKNKPRQITPAPLDAISISKINNHQPWQKEASEFMPKQENGIKPACALPYHFYVDAKLNPSQTAVTLAFECDKSSVGTAFTVNNLNIYDKEDVKAWAIAVATGDKIENDWQLEKFDQGTYKLAVHGANGFYREFEGTKYDPLITINCKDEESPSKRYSGNIQLQLENASNDLIELVIVDNAYKAANKLIKINKNSKQTIVLNLSLNKGWYDFTLKAKGFENYYRRYAGHIENGKESITDPFMGAIV